MREHWHNPARRSPFDRVDWKWFQLIKSDIYTNGGYQGISHAIWKIITKICDFLSISNSRHFLDCIKDNEAQFKQSIKHHPNQKHISLTTHGNCSGALSCRDATGLFSKAKTNIRTFLFSHHSADTLIQRWLQWRWDQSKQVIGSILPVTGHLSAVCYNGVYPPVSCRYCLSAVSYTLLLLSGLTC